MKNKILFLVSLILLTFAGFSQPANDNCANAITLTVGNPVLCGQTTNGATTQTDEHCAGSGGGITPKTVWYKFVATSTTMVLNVLRTNNINCFGYISVYGPNPACMPGAGAAILSCVLMNGDPGVYPQLTGLTVGATYFINYNGQGCGGSGDNFHTFCIGVFGVAANNSVTSPSIISSCGTTFNGTTQGGYSPSGTGTGFRNLDGNLSTTCPACGAQPGADIPFVINNDSWFSFCSGTTGTWQITFNVGTCVFSGVNSGLQMALFTGTPTNLTWHSQAANPTYSGGTWTSPNISLNAGQCAYLVVDGFAGDACSYSYTLTNISGGCIVLPVELSNFNVRYDEKSKNVLLDWTTETEVNNDYFTIERSKDLVNFEVVDVVKGNGNSNITQNYHLIDNKPLKGTSYYRLKQTDYDGQFEYFKPVAVTIKDIKDNYILSSTDRFIQLTDVYEYNLYTLVGKLARSGRDNIIRTGELSSGIYILRVGPFTEKIIVK